MSEVKRHSVTGYGRQDINYNDPEGEFVYYEDYAALQQKLDAMAAENVALKQWAKEADELWVNDCDLDSHLDSVPQTPATDAYLNSVRAEGVEMLAKAISRDRCHDRESQMEMGEFFDFAVDFAAQLRSGTHDTADKAGAK